MFVPIYTDIETILYNLYMYINYYSSLHVIVTHNTYDIDQMDMDIGFWFLLYFAINASLAIS